MQRASTRRKAGAHQLQRLFFGAGVIVDGCRSKDDGEKGKKKKDPNAPKAPASAYLLWANDNRERIKVGSP